MTVKLAMQASSGQAVLTRTLRTLQPADRKEWLSAVRLKDQDSLYQLYLNVGKWFKVSKTTYINIAFVEI